MEIDINIGKFHKSNEYNVSKLTPSLLHYEMNQQINFPKTHNSSPLILFTKLNLEFV